MERMQIGLGCEEILHMKYIVFWYFKINCFSGVDTICRSLSSKSQYMWYIAHPISGTPKDLPQSGIWYCSNARKVAFTICPASVPHSQSVVVEGQMGRMTWDAAQS